MAKKKAETLPRRSAPETYHTKMVVALRGTEAWRDWVKGLASHDRGKTIPQLIEEALDLYAKHTGFRPKQPRRIDR